MRRPLTIFLLLALAAWAAARFLPQPAGNGGGDAGEAGPLQPAGYVGSEACRSCHPHEFDAIEGTSHSDVPWLAPEPARPREIAIGSTWMQAYALPDSRGYHRLRRRCFDLRDQQWRSVETVLAETVGTTPASSPRHPASLAHRSFEMDCAGCHASGLTLRIDPVAGALTGSWRAIACDCEACHGPGRRHIESPDPRDSLPRLAELPVRASVAICARCHGGPPSVGDFAPEDAPYFVGVLGREQGVYPNGVASGQIYQDPAFVSSACHRKGGLTCTGCHDAHGLGLRHAAESQDDLCTGCHAGLNAPKHTHHDPVGPGARCVACHMPKLNGGLLRDQTDHRIGSPLPASPYVPDACTSCHEDRDKTWADRAYRLWWGPPSRTLLEAVRVVQGTHTSDAPVEATALDALLRMDDPFFRAIAARRGAEPRRALADPLPEVRYMAVQRAQSAGRVADLRAALNDPQPVIRAAAYLALDGNRPSLTPRRRDDLEIAVRLQPRLTAARILLGTDLLERGEVRRAAGHFEQAIVYDPMSKPGWLGLADCYEKLGHVEKAKSARDRLEQLRRLRPG